MYTKLDKYMPYLCSNISNFAVILDPRLKHNYIVEKGNEQPILAFKQYFEMQYLSNIQHQQLPVAENIPCQETNKTVFAALYKQKSVAVQDEIISY